MEDELLFETPNGSVITESEAKSKYGDRFQSLLDSGTFKQTDKTADKKEEVKIDFDVEAFYISPNGSEIKGADVVKKYGNRSQSLVDDGTLKKKTRLSFPLGKRQIWLALHQFKKHQIPYWNLEVY